MTCDFSYSVGVSRDEISWACYQANLTQSVRFETMKDIVSKEGDGILWITIEVVL